MDDMPNLVTIIEKLLGGMPIAEHIGRWEDTIFSLIIVAAISFVALAASRKVRAVPGRLEAACEIFVGGIDDFVCGIIGPAGRRFTPFIGKLFIYILFMNLSGLIPLFKSPTANWSVTLALGLCVFVYVQYSGIKTRGFIGFIDHLMGSPRGILAFSVVIPIMMFFLHIISELVRPISLSLRLRSNIWGDELLLSFISGLGIGWVPLLVFNSLLAILASIVQAAVFSLLATIYFALTLAEE